MSDKHNRYKSLEWIERIQTLFGMYAKIGFDTRDFRKMLNNARVFEIGENSQFVDYLTTAQLNTKYQTSQVLNSLPFDCCIFKTHLPILGQTQVTYEQGATDNYRCIKVAALCIDIRRRKKNGVRFFMLGQNGATKEQLEMRGADLFFDRSPVVNENKVKQRLLWFHANYFLGYCMNAINLMKSQGVPTLGGREIKDVKSMVSKGFHPDNYVRISPRTLSEKKSSDGTTKADFHHRWEVSGHWRKCQGKGKDRYGERSEFGRTWIKSHVRGPEDKPFVKKKRIVEEFQYER